MNSADRCTAEPISQLRLERYALAELPAAEHVRVEQHLSACAACRHDFEQLRASQVELPPLPAVVPQLNELPAAVQRIVLPARGGRSRGEGTRRALPLRTRWALGAGATLTLAAATLLALRAQLIAPLDPIGGDGGPVVKGGELALELVGERGGAIAHDPSTFVPGDRFAVLVTCPPSRPLYWQLVVYQGGEAFFPLAAHEPLRCANAVQLPGAFTLTGTAPARVCLALSAAPIARDSLARTLPDPHACTTLAPAQ